MTTVSSTESPNSSTGSPSIAINTSKIDVSSLVQFRMQTMTKTMNEYETIGVFEPSCREFLTRQLFTEDPHVFNIECKVSNQQLLSGRRVLTIGRLRQMQESSSSLLVDVEVTGVVVQSNDVLASDDIDFGDMVYSAFAEDSDVFVNSLKNEGDIAGIDTFDDLESVTGVTQSTSKDAVVDEKGSSNPQIKAGALAALIVGLVAFVLLAIAFVYQVRIHFADDDSLISGMGVALPSPHVNYSNVQSELSAQRHDSNLSYAYSLDDAVDSPNSLISPSKSPFNESPMRVQREIVAPPGKLGIIIDTSSQGPIVHSVKSGSVLAGLVFEGDLIIALDEENTSEWTAHNLTKLVASRSKCERAITVLSSVAI